MDQMNLVTLLVISFPEAVIVVMLGFTLVGMKIPLKKVVIIGLIQTGFSYILRSLPIIFGLHSLVQIMFLVILVYLITRLNYKIVITSMLLSTSIYLVIEMSMLSFFSKVYPLEIKDILVDPVRRILFFVPQFFAVTTLIVIMKITGYKLIDVSESWGNYEQEE